MSPLNNTEILKKILSSIIFTSFPSISLLVELLFLRGYDDDGDELLRGHERLLCEAVDQSPGRVAKLHLERRRKLVSWEDGRRRKRTGEETKRRRKRAVEKTRRNG